MYSYDKDLAGELYGVLKYGPDEIKLAVKNTRLDGYTIKDIDQIDPSKPSSSYIDSTKKILIDNEAPYGHILTSWLYLLLSELEISKEPMTILFAKSPDNRTILLEHSSSVSDYLHKRLTEKGHKVVYVDSNQIYINNFTSFLMPLNVRPGRLSIVSDFLSEGLDYSKEPSNKIYLSRAKTTASNGNQKITIPDELYLNDEELQKLRNKNKHMFSDRIDDEKALEDYLVTLGFTIVCPEDIKSYEEQLQLFASSKIVMSITSSALSPSLAMAPNTFVVELVTPMYTQVDNEGFLIKDRIEYHHHYRDISTIKNKLYIGISNKYHSTSDVINSIESNASLKSLLSS